MQMIPMQMTEVSHTPAGHLVQGYGPGFFRIGGVIHQGPLLAAPNGFGAWDGEAGAILALAGVVDVVLLGTGATIAPDDAALRTVLHEAGLGVEAMATPTACRVYNMIVSEGRRAALAALPVA